MDKRYFCSGMIGEVGGSKFYVPSAQQDNEHKTRRHVKMFKAPSVIMNIETCLEAKNLIR